MSVPVVGLWIEICLWQIGLAFGLAPLSSCMMLIERATMASPFWLVMPQEPVDNTNVSIAWGERRIGCLSLTYPDRECSRSGPLYKHLQRGWRWQGRGRRRGVSYFLSIISIFLYLLWWIGPSEIDSLFVRSGRSYVGSKKSDDKARTGCAS